MNQRMKTLRLVNNADTLLVMGLVQKVIALRNATKLPSIHQGFLIVAHPILQ